MDEILDKQIHNYIQAESFDLAKRRPILFTGPMVCALLDGSKTQTRRKPSFRAEVGDILWVRETWAPADNRIPFGNVWYKADESCKNLDGFGIGPEQLDIQTWKWHSSIFMPHRASRIWLLVTAVRYEPLQDIKIDDIKAEGIPSGRWDAYADLWESINGKTPGHAWADNPTIKVVSFVRIKP